MNHFDAELVRELQHLFIAVELAEIDACDARIDDKFEAVESR